ncbi:adenosine deaminase [Thalassotalea aquiviva]|uniref:adenosine deaminase n=1 Tax=Thalassotalea aquiviva TaxID=3242415 RepID=UPI00352A8E85
MVISTLPLIDLHRHLDGNIRPFTIWELAQQHNMPVPAESFEEFLPHLLINDKAENLMDFLQKLDWGVKVLKTLDDCQRIARENAEDLQLAGIDYAELRFSPLYIAMQNNLNPYDVVEAIIDGFEQGCKQYKVKGNLIGILSRTYGVDSCQQELDALLPFKHKLVAIDLAGDEGNKPASLFEQHFKQVVKADLAITIHAGEAAGPESVWDAINLLHANRIGHGVNSIEDPKLIDFLIKNQITLECCLTSNYQTGTIADLANHPIKFFLDQGVRVCLNTDDPGVENIELRDEFKLAQQIVGLNKQQIEKIQLNALNAAFISDSEKSALLKQKNA